jgi:hypothetical protein
MKHLFRWAFAGLLLLLVPTGAGNAEVPSWIPAPKERGPSPIWVSAEEATTPDGRLRSELFNPIEEMNLKRHLESQRKARAASSVATKEKGERCHSWIFIPPHPVVEDLTLESLLAYSQLAFVGIVEDQKEGFYHGHPNSLLEIRVQEILKAPAGYEGITSLFATYPHVEMKVGEELVCMRSDRYPARPITGKGILILAANIPDWDPLVVAPNTEVIFFEDDEGNAVLPGRFGDVLDPPAWSSVVQRALDTAKGPPEGGTRR